MTQENCEQTRSRRPSQQYDAVMLCSYGGPRKNEDVLPFMRNATAGRGVPDERLLEVSGHYRNFSGISPINAHNLRLRREIELELARRGEEIEVTLGNRNWTPFFHDTLCDLAVQGKKRVLCIFTSAYVSYSGCRQYREDLAAAQKQLADQGWEVQLDKIRAYYTTEGFIAANLENLQTTVTQVQEETGVWPRIAFVTHSIPTPMETGSGPADHSRPSYAQQHLTVCQELISRLAEVLPDAPDFTWDLAYCSRSGPPQMPWLEPDINDLLTDYAQAGCQQVVTVPIGFICDHMEVVFDLDTEAAATAQDLGLGYRRVPTVGTDPRFVSSLVDLIFERSVAAFTGDAFSLTETSETGIADAIEPTWPAWPPPADSRASGRAPDLPVVCQSEPES